MASPGYEMALGSTLHQVHDATAHEEPIDTQYLNEEAKGEKDDNNEDDDIAYIGTTQMEHPRIVNPLALGAPPADTEAQNTAPVSSSSKSKKKKPIKPKVDDKTETTKAEEAAFWEKRKTDQESACATLYCDDYPAFKALHQHLNLPKASDPNMDLSAELHFMDAEWQKTHPLSFFKTHIFTITQVTRHLENCVGDTVKYSETEHYTYKVALDTLAIQSMQVPFPKPSKVPGARNILINKLTFVMVNKTGQHTNHLTGDEHQCEMLGLLPLHKHVAIYCWQVHNISGCYCPFCNYVGIHHIAINNHNHFHWHLGLLCSYPKCFQVHVEAKAMLNHMADDHDLRPYGSH